MTAEQEMLPVEQCDREAAKYFRRGLGGKYDREFHRLCLAFRDHRLAATKAADERVERLEQALKIADSWLDRWAQHVGDCAGRDVCTCGLTRVRYDARAALAEAGGRGG